jgi:hypothetical protein
MTDLTLTQLWFSYAALGGNLDASELDAALHGKRELSEHDHDITAQALNEYFLAKGQDHPVAYTNELDTRED